MRSRISIGKYAVYGILESLLVYVLTLAFMGYMNFSMDIRILAAVIVGSNIIFYILVSYPVTAKAVGILMPLSSLVFYLARRELFISYAKLIWRSAIASAEWFWKYCFSSEVKLEKSYSVIIIICYVILCTILIYLLVTVWRKVVIMMTAGVVLLYFLWYFGYDNAFKYLQIYLFLSFLVFSFVQYDIKETAWKLKREKYSGRTTVVWMACAALSTMAIFFMINLLPPEFKPVNVQWLNDNVFSVLEGAGLYGNNSDSRSNPRYYSVSTFGYQQKTTKLGGAVKLSDKLLLKVKVDGDIKPPYYLRGTVKDIYTGSYWTKSTGRTKNIKSSSQISALIGSDYKVNYFKDAMITIYPQSLNTVSIFNLWKPSQVEINSDSYNFDDSGDLTVPGNKMKAKAYKVSSRVPLVYSDDLSTVGALSGQTKKKLETYLNVPEDIPDRVKSLTMNITNKYGTNYEKADAIQNYLRYNFPYDLNTTVVPEGRDFVDYFLFDEKKGYCTYYASAMAVMCRIIGIPSRYVEGFVLEDKDYGTDGFYKAIAARAHAWVELYFDGYGWVRFEPTASFTQPDYNRPEVETKSEVTVPQTNQSGDLKIPQINKKNQVDEENTDVPTGTVRKKIPAYVFAVLTVIIILLLRIFVKLCSRIKAIKRADRMNGKDAVIEYYSLLEKKLKSGGIERHGEETPAEFGIRVNEQLSPYDIDMPEITNIFNRTRFGNGKIDEDERIKFKNVIKIIDRYIKDRKGIIKYIAIKYIL